VVPVLNRWIEAAIAKGVPIYASRDWHPVDHLSFATQGGQWPPHCIQDSEGANFHPELSLPASAIKVTKGVRFDQDQYSAFDQTGLATHLTRQKIKRLFVGGLAEDVCVKASVLDALKHGFEVVLIADATRPVTPEGGEQARKEMQQAGAKIMETAAGATGAI
jgi:nicotinamidase/pyrazinamidase